MAEPPEFWTFVVVNVFVFVFGGFLTLLSFAAYRSSNWNRSFRNATVAFGFLTIGSGADLIYQMGIKGSYELSARELLILQSAEGFLTAIGFGLLFYSIYRYSSDRTTQVPTTADSYEAIQD